MEIGINDGFDSLDYEVEQQEEFSEQDYDSQQESDEGDLIDQLLRDRGISDRSKIKFENEEGSIEEVDWDSLSPSEQLELMRTSSSDPDIDLDDSEIELINAIRTTKLSPKEYLQYVAQRGAGQYAAAVQQQSQPTYSVDMYSDDELYVADQMSRSNLTEDEALEALEKAKSNETLYEKQINALRDEYKQIEDQNIQYAQYQQLAYQQQMYNQFAYAVQNSIQNFTDFAGYDLNMDYNDMQELYEFVTGFDAAGTSHLGKALNDPDTMVKMAWFALNGEKMIQDITDYYNREITNVRKASYEKGLQDANKSNVTYVPKSRKKSSYDLDDDF